MTAPTLCLEKFAVREVRNLARVEVELAPRVNVVFGDNGQGKTSLLEGIYLAATSRSFRTRKASEILRHGADVASVRAQFAELEAGKKPIVREQTVAIGNAGTVARLDNNRPPSLADFATRSPVVVFHAGELSLSAGPAAARRTLLDRLALFRDPTSADDRARYAKALRARQELLRRGASAEAAVEAFETLAAKHGSALTRARKGAADAMTAEIHRAFEAIAAPDLTLEVRFRAGGSEDEAEALDWLRHDRRRDAHRPSAGFGPHRDDLELRVDGHPAREVASQGQHRALTLALKTAEMTAIQEARGLEPILLLDDVSSELDPSRTAALFHFLALTRGQIVLTTTRRDLIDTPGTAPPERRDIAVEGGRVEVVGS